MAGGFSQPATRVRHRRRRRRSPAEDTAAFDWRKHGNRRRGGVYVKGRKGAVGRTNRVGVRVVGPRTVRRLNRQGRIDWSRTKRLEGGRSNLAKRAPKPGKLKGRANIKAGMSGSRVRRVQRLLGSPQSGRFGSRTARRVRRFQRRHGLQVDGVVGRQTLWALRQVRGRR